MIMWLFYFVLSIGCAAFFTVASISFYNSNYAQKHRFNLFNALFAGAFIASVLMFYPIHHETVGGSLTGNAHAALLSVFNAMQIFTIGCDYEIVEASMQACPEYLVAAYRIWASVLLVIAPVFTFGFVLSLFKNLSAYANYRFAYFKDAYVFSELNAKSLALASDIRANDKHAAIIFTDIFEEEEESGFELLEEAKQLRAICFKNDITVINFYKHSKKSQICFFTIGVDETENLNQSLRLIERYKTRENTRLYVFSTSKASEALLSAADKGAIRVRRINEVRSLINRVLYEDGAQLFTNAVAAEDGVKDITAVVIGLGRHGTEMVKALSWFGQMDGYRIEIHAFDKDPLAREKLEAIAPELMSERYNGVAVAGEAQYRICVHAGVDTQTITFAKEIAQLQKATYVLVALGNDEWNVNTALDVRMYFARMGIHPVIQAIVYNSQQKKALQNIRNFKGQSYDIAFIGDKESSYSREMIMESELEQTALQRHLKWGKEDDFWNYEYNYRSSVASAIHMRARILCGIAAADKREDELTVAERDAIETLEHRRWNAYMRAEGYVYSGSKDPASRNDLAKMHHDLVDYASLSEEDKRKDSRVGTK